MGHIWIKGPVGHGAEYRLTRQDFHTVLVMVPTLAAGTRLLDLIPLLDGDFRVQTVFTVPCGDETWQYPADLIRSRGGLTLPWHQARQHTWDLVLTASHRHIEQVHGKMLLLPHGAGNVMARRYSRKAGTPTSPTTGLDAELLTYRGRVIPAALALSHHEEHRVLAQRCPEAAHTAFLAGDICLDRMAASLPHRRHYRAALGVSADERLITISSTWTSTSTFGRHLDLYSRLLEEVRGERVKVAAVLHPLIWEVHGEWQVRAWLSRAISRGLLVIPPQDGWQATMIASDHVLGDHGSTTCYAAAIGRPVHLAAFPDGNIWPNSPAGVVARSAPRLNPDLPILPQLSCARPNTDVRDAIASCPGQAAKALRATMYRLLGIPEPPWPATPAPAGLPKPMWSSPGSDTCLC